jgi:hypothetical protein
MIRKGSTVTLAGDPAAMFVPLMGLRWKVANIVTRKGTKYADLGGVALPCGMLASVPARVRARKAA